MIDLSFSVRNPFHNEKKNPWRDLYQGEWLIGKNTALEIGFFKYNYTLFSFGLSTNFTGSDHAGPSLEISLFGWEFRIAMPDTRHWNYDENRWYTYKDGEKE